jgi:predicted dehydrogenase
MSHVRHPLGVGIVGCGLIGRKRSQALGSGGRLVACADRDGTRSASLARDTGAQGLSDWQRLLEHPGVDLVIVSTLHDSLACITEAAMHAGKHVLVEKPAARTAAELAPLVDLAGRLPVKVRVGFNHRYHRALRKARTLVDEGVVGPLMYVRGRYGHGGRLGYDREWRADPKLSGGGELIDQGPHLIDLARWFLGDFVSVQGFAHTYFWDMPVDDNGFMLLKTAGQQVAFLHASCTEWKNLFSMEIYGRTGKIEISGLGGSYGVERVTLYRMLPEMGPPETTAWEYPMADDSWAVELAEFYEDIHLDRQPAAGLADAWKAMQVVESVYEESRRDHRP